ncbi:hypothetical protein SAMN05216257_102476 [Meinhardsimonia xiamenensis]|jgi:hypothetical protein|uniref:Uncharacterized protein n=1 Tax=Meinhardsimonia xiamenensis TaxID=990712 RepID=A0A1G9BAW9_9RHOB|nr:hypothetical protein [Meinhardsimonia xiamenensis]PRX35049.1 hypothetical protein LV81_01643 [Meinhardsimonia xiamenensis]SDK36651.1 hypothetical protein SAMN05216257_102476 [Meinhardsimonia xiamenensis]
MKDTATISIEANLLFTRAVGDALLGETGEILATLEMLGFRVTGTRVEDGRHLLISCDRVQVLAAYCPVPFEVSEFSGTQRPGHDPLADRLVFETLEAHRASVKLLVTDRPDAMMGASHDEKRHLCWELADLLLEDLGAQLVYWNETDMLFSAGEFARSAPPVQHAPLVIDPADTREPVSLAAGAEAPKLHPGAHIFALSPEEELEELERDRLKAATAEDWARVSRGIAPEEGERELIDEETARAGTNYGLLILLMALSFPVAMAVLFYQLIRGPNARLAAKAVCVTALGVALDQSGMAAEVLSLL